MHWKMFKWLLEDASAANIMRSFFGTIFAYLKFKFIVNWRNNIHLYFERKFIFDIPYLFLF